MSKKGIDFIELIEGIIFIIISILAFANPTGILGTMVFVFSIAMVIRGISVISRYVLIRRELGYSSVIHLIAGIFDIGLGILLVFNINVGVVALAVLFPIWFITDCIMNLVYLELWNSENKGWYWLTIILNILGIMAGALLLFNPLSSAATLAYIVAIYMLLIGIQCIILSISRYSPR
ncbi:MAG: HdeD family acid-resistance protein [Lachnospiraceae bacterium]